MHERRSQDIGSPELSKHLGHTRAVIVEGSLELVFIVDQTTRANSYECVAPGDFRGQHMTGA